MYPGIFWSHKDEIYMSWQKVQSGRISNSKVNQKVQLEFVNIWKKSPTTLLLKQNEQADNLNWIFA